jgi:hypothetical protein
MLDKLWDFLVDSAMVFFVPLVCSYFACNSNAFLNVSCNEASHIEKMANTILAPCHYLLIGQQAEKNAQGRWVFKNRFDYETHFALKTALSSIVAIPSFIAGVSVKALALCTPSGLSHHKELTSALNSSWTESNREKYAAYGIKLGNEPEWFQPQGHKRRPGDENNLHHEKQALAQIGALLDAANIPWWVDCGTCLGAYRYGGVIPWDEDVDVAVLMPDFDNVKRVLSQLDPAEYTVQDWSSREHPKSYMKVYVKKSRTFVDIYHFKILPETKELKYVLALENAFFLPEWWKIRERRFVVPVAFDTVFPLKKVVFDGIVINVPNKIESYLQRYYGENLAPAKIFDPQTNKYEKDLSHPYWLRTYAH